MFRGRLTIRALAALLSLAGAASSFAVALLGDSWPADSDVVIHLSLSRPSSGLQDGSASWNASAADALQIWIQHLDTVQFVQGGSVPSGDGDGRNSVFFSSSVYGESFGKNTIAVTVGYNEGSDKTIVVETDVIFNSAERWNSYRGPVQVDSQGCPRSTSIAWRCMSSATSSVGLTRTNTPSPARMR